MADTDNAEDVTGHLPGGAHYDDPAVAFAVHDGLGDVGDHGETEEDSVEVGGGLAGTEAGPLTAGVIFCGTMGRHCYFWGLKLARTVL